MHLLLPLASILGIEAEEIAGRLKRSALAWGAVCIFVVIAAAFLLAAANVALTDLVGPLWAPLIIAGVALLGALSVYISIRVTADIAHRRATKKRQSAETTALVTTAAMTVLPIVLRMPLMRRIGIPVGGAIAAAWLLMKPGPNSPKKRLPKPDVDDEV